MSDYYDDEPSLVSTTKSTVGTFWQKHYPKIIFAGSVIATARYATSRIRIARPNEVLAITGFGVKQGIKFTRRAFVLPWVQTEQALSLRVRDINGVVTGFSQDMFKVHVEYAMTIRPDDTDDSSIMRYAKYMSEHSDSTLVDIITEQATGAVRTSIANMNAMDVFTGREVLHGNLSTECDDLLYAMGLKRIKLTIGDINDPPSSAGVSGLFHARNSANLSVELAASEQTQCSSAVVEAKAKAERDIATAQFRRQTGEADAINDAAVRQKQQEVSKGVESARRATEIEKKRADHVPAAMAAKETAEINAQAELIRAEVAAKSIHELLAATPTSPELAVLTLLLQTGQYGDLLEKQINAFKGMSPNVNIVQTSGGAGGDTGKVVQDLYNAAVPPLLQVSKLLDTTGMFANKGASNGNIPANKSKPGSATGMR